MSVSVVQAVPCASAQAASWVKWASPAQPPSQVPGAGVTSSFARTMPVTEGGAIDTALPYHAGLDAVAPALEMASNTVLAPALPVVMFWPVAKGVQPERSSAQVCHDHVSPGGFICELAISSPLPSSFSTAWTIALGAAPATAGINIATTKTSSSASAAEMSLTTPSFTTGRY